jgi:acyl-CoA thioester hydrolase
MSPASFKTSLRVTWADTDAAQVVHYSKYFVFFERAEEEFYASLGFNFAAFRDRGLWFPRVEAHCLYKKPARFNDLLEIEVTVEELAGKSAKLGFNIVKQQTNDLLASGYLVVVAADKQTGKATQIPSEIFEKLKPFSKQIL